MADSGSKLIHVDTKGIGDDGQIHWKSDKFKSKSYRPLQTFSNENFMNVSESIDIVLLSANDHQMLRKYTMGLKSIINKDTIILIDSTFALVLEDLILKFIPNVAALSIISDVDVQILPIGTTLTYHQRGEKVSTSVGFTSAVKNQLINSTLKENGSTGGKLKSFMESLRTTGVSPLNLFTIGKKPSINSLCWKSVLSFTTFEVLSLIYGPLNIANSIHSSIIKGIFMEVLGIAYKTCDQEFPNPDDSSKSDAYFKQLITNFNQKHSSYQIKGEPGVKMGYLENQLISPFCIQAFKNGFNTYVDLNLKQIINMGKSLKIDCPRTECIYSFYHLIKPLHNDKKFDWVTKEYYTERKLLDLPKLEMITQLPQQQLQQNLQTNSINSSYVSLQNGSSQPQMMISQDILAQIYSHSSLASKKPTVEANAGKIVSGTGLNHPRFSQLPTNLPNGKSVGYKQIKSAIYKNTKGTTDAENFGRAHEFIYQYGNLNNTFETVNNRYGGVDSLSYFKNSISFGQGKKNENCEILYKTEGNESLVVGKVETKDAEDDEDEEEDIQMASATEKAVS